MRSLNLCALPAPLLILLATAFQPAAAEKAWPYNLPPDQKYYPEHAPLVRRWSGHDDLVRRHVEIRERMATQTPIGMRKMSGDPDEMFFPEYWIFDDSASSPTSPALLPALTRTSHPPSRRPNGVLHEGGDLPINKSMLAPLLPPFLPHFDHGFSSSRSHDVALNVLSKRDYKCPSDTKSCSGIKRPNNCCATDEDCVIIADTGLGDVGCCPSGQSCGGSVSSCDTANGYHSCPGSPNGGCCIPGYSCQDVGCILNVKTSTTSRVVVVTASQVLSTITSTYYVRPETVVKTVVETITVSPSFVTIAQATTCSSGFNSCPASQGGGCCPTDRVCGYDNYCGPSSATTVTEYVPPVRPTGNDVTTSTTVSICPYGYYMCSAYYIGGCCQVGRDCSMTNCPATSYTTVISGSTVVIVPTYVNSQASTPVDVETVGATPTPSDGGVVVDSVATSQTLATGGSCQAGWFGCGGAGGGGCCPTGYQCGESCTATVGGVPPEVAKQTPSTAAILDACGRWLATMAGAVGLLMIYL